MHFKEKQLWQSINFPLFVAAAYFMSPPYYKMNTPYYKINIGIFPLHFMDFIGALFSHDCLTFASRELIVLLSRANKPGINLI